MTSRNGHGQPSSATHIGIVGGGYSGAAMVYHLARSTRGPLDLLLYEPRRSVGSGVAYSVTDEHLLLNVPAGKLSIDPERPGDFLTWCLSRGHQVSAGAFLPRAWFGEYAEARMAEQVQSARDRVTIRHSNTRIVAAADCGDGICLMEESGYTTTVAHAVHALGHGPTKVPPVIAPLRESPRVLLSPWNRQDMTHVAGGAERVLLIGTGLTMCDAAITLARMGFRGEMTAISRRGLLPAAHGPSDPSALSSWRDGLSQGSLRVLRRELRDMTHRESWRSSIDALRPRTQELWGSFSLHEQARFIKRLAPYWDAHRHRLPPECAEAIKLLRHTGSLRVLRGHVRKVVDSRDRLICELAPYQQRAAETLHADAIVLCTGPEPDPRRWNSPLIGQLLRDGIASPEANGLGLRSTYPGLLVGRGAVVQHRLSTLGPLRRGSLWESTAVPEISAQAASLAQHLTETPSVRGATRGGGFQERHQFTLDPWERTCFDTDR